MYVKLEITGELEVVTGLHIGASTQFSAIGAVDAPIIRDMQSDLPIIPGSSFKGKLRTLLAKLLVKSYDKHVASEPNQDDPELLRLFGCSAKNKIQKSRLIFSDMVLSNIEEFREIGIEHPTEIKFENTIGRLNGIATPRQIERVIRGAKFPLSIIYDVECLDDVEDDIFLLAKGLQLLQYDYLGGHGSRGYGKVKFHNLKVQAVVGKISLELLKECNDTLKEVCAL